MANPTNPSGTVPRPAEGFAVGLPPLQTLPAETAPLIYRPVSLLAIAAVIFAGFYGLLMVAGGLRAFYVGSPFLIGFWGFALPLAGLALATAARIHVRLAEGTRVGGRLAAWAWWLCLAGGLGYAAFWVGTAIAVRQQADQFAQEWFDKLKAGKAGMAFVSTLPPQMTLNVDEENFPAMEARFNMAKEAGMKGPLASFRESSLVLATQQAHALQGPIEVETQGVVDWNYANDAYTVPREYRITTPEYVLHCLLTVKGSKSRTNEYEARKWQVVLDETQFTTPARSPMAVSIAALRKESVRFLKSWTSKLKRGEIESAYLDTCAAEDRARFQAQMHAAHTAALAGTVAQAGQGPAAWLAGAAPFVDAESIRLLCLPGYRRFDVDQFVTTEGMNPGDQIGKVVENGVKGLFKPAPDSPRVMQIDSQEMSVQPWTFNPDRVRLTHDCLVGLLPGLRGDATLVVETEPGALEKQQSATWRVVQVRLTSAQDMSRQPGMPQAADPMTFPSGRLPMGGKRK